MPRPLITEVDQIPLILTLDEVASLYRISPATVRRNLQAGTFRPRPWDRYPYRWKREDVLADLKRVRDDDVVRAHGRRRPVKASLPTPPLARTR